MRLPPMLAGRFLRRENRFRATVWVNGEEVAAHVPSPGRLAELLLPGAPVWVAPRDGAGRRTPCDLLLVEHGDAFVSIDSRLPNALYLEALRSGLAGMDGYDRVTAEVPLGASRIDFRLDGPAGSCWIEVKSVTLVDDGVARFPDAPTARGRRHVEELAAAVDAGDAAAIVFVVQRHDARVVAPHHRNDPAFAAALREAAARRVALRAYRCRVSLEAIAIDGEIPVALSLGDAA